MISLLTNCLIKSSKLKLTAIIYALSFKGKFFRSLVFSIPVALFRILLTLILTIKIVNILSCWITRIHIRDTWIDNQINGRLVQSIYGNGKARVCCSWSIIFVWISKIWRTLRVEDWPVLPNTIIIEGQDVATF